MTLPRVRRSSVQGFTLVEMLVTLAVIMLALGMIFGLGDALLPQTRLDASATLVGGTFDQARSHAIFAHETLLFVYDFTNRSVATYFPYEMDFEGRPMGPGRTLVQGPRSLEPGIAFQSVRLPDGELREREPEVAFPISPLGRVAPHDVVIYNPDHPETEVLTLRISGLTNRYEILEGIPPLEVLQDVDFR